MSRIILATRKSPLALAQAELAAERLRAHFPGTECALLKVVTTGDRKLEWSLEKLGGKGLFTAELEQALLGGEADVAVHSSKDLPNESTRGLVIAGYLPREDPRDVLIVRHGVRVPPVIATSSPRRRLQISLQFPNATFTEIRGNVDTRLKKIVGGVADATVLAAAGLKRLGLASWPGLEFHPQEFGAMVPAVGQGAIALQCRAEDAAQFAAALDPATALQLGLERALQGRVGGGCQLAFAAHATAGTLYFFHEKTGQRTVTLSPEDFARPAPAVERILKLVGWPGQSISPAGD
ncbi:MAG TPA: hydroxymethylbilane synthase [Opitutaceae bacterium]|nr:hydroxymethylbilane synthase [Opitutaceae bacterium]